MAVKRRVFSPIPDRGYKFHLGIHVAGQDGEGMSAASALIGVKDLAQQLGASDIVVVDCRFNLMDPAAGREAWGEAHIPGARYADLDHDLSQPKNERSGRHPLPDPDAFAATLGRLGITPESFVVVYDDSSGSVAARLWWLLHWVGHSNVSLLDGGLAAWKAAGLPLDTSEAQATAGRYPIKPGSVPALTTDEVVQALRQQALVLLDARDAKRFAGEVEPIDPVAGHIPGAVNRPLQLNLDAHGLFRPQEDLAADFREHDQKGLPLACMCGSGVTACHNILARVVAGGLQSADDWPALYVGSWSEWITDPAKSVATGVENG